MKKKSVWIVCLIVMFFGSILLFHIVNDMEFCGLQVKSGERLSEMTSSMNFVDKPENLDELIELDGQSIPYDRFSNTFYISQSTEVAEYAGTFRVVGDNCEIYIERDEVLDDKLTAISQGHVFKLWFLAGDDYATANLIYSGLPVLSIGTDEDSVTTSYVQGEMVLQNPDDRDINGMSVKQSAVLVKQNENTGTITFKLYKTNYEEERNLSLLGLGKHTSWKLYPVSDKDDTLVRTVLSSYVWNGVCGNENLQRGMQFAEVIVDGQYNGLYNLTPKAGKGFLGLGETDRVYECEDILEDGSLIYEVIGDEDTSENRAELESYQSMLSDFTTEDLNRFDQDNLINYYIYLQTVCGIQNSQEEYYVIAKKQGEDYFYQRMPEKSNYVWGIYPSKIGWQSMTATENIMEDAVYDLIAEQDASIEARTTKRWNDLRSDVLSTPVLTQLVYSYEQKLADSGYIIRMDKQDTYDDSCDILQDMIIKRMDYLDNYYNGEEQ
ncbi:MAG: CotH kinase family protein [Lachnospiraceae bacterium]